MPKVKMPRKSTSVDMTAMCDVAFLLLSFFILTTKFKAPDQLSVVTPKSVSTKPVDAKNVVQIIMDKAGKVYFSVGDENPDQKQDIIDMVDQQKSLGLSSQEKAAFVKDQLKRFNAPGIPIDTVNNELTVWMGAASRAFQGKTMALMVKGDNSAKYPSFKGVIDAFKKNEIFKFSMITDPEGVPPGTALFKKRESGAKD